MVIYCNSIKKALKCSIFLNFEIHSMYVAIHVTIRGKQTKMLIELRTLLHTMWVMIRNKYVMFEVDTLRNKEVSKLKGGDNSEIVGPGARVTHIVTFKVGDIFIFIPLDENKSRIYTKN